MYRTYSVNDMPQPIMRHENAKECEKPKEQISECPDNAACDTLTNNGGLLAGLKLDDIIIFAVIVMLLMDNCDDKPLIIALGFLLFSDLF